MVYLMSKLRSWLLERTDNDYDFVDKEDRAVQQEDLQTRKGPSFHCTHPVPYLGDHIKWVIISPSHSGMLKIRL